MMYPLATKLRLDGGGVRWVLGNHEVKDRPFDDCRGCYVRKGEPQHEHNCPLESSQFSMDSK